MLKQLLTIPLIFSLCACANKPELSPEVQKIIDKTQADMVFVKGGSFMMGDPGYIRKDGKVIVGSPENRKKYPNASWEAIASGKGARPVHKVTLSDYSMGKYEVTWAEFDAYYRDIGKELYKKRKNGISRARKNNWALGSPSWQASKDYCLWLGEKTGKHFDLPTEAQWEYAARSRGKYVIFATNDGEGRMEDNGYSKDEINIAPNTHSGGLYPPNPLGLYDMSGNYNEWINDWYNEEYYKNSTEVNPQGAKAGERKIARGGSSAESFGAQNVYRRTGRLSRSKALGFRCVLNP